MSSINIQTLLDKRKKIGNLENKKVNDREIVRFVQEISDNFKTEVKELKLFYSNQEKLNFVIIEALDHIKTPTEPIKAKREYFAGLIKVLALEIKKDPSVNKYFITDLLSTKERWTPLRKIVIAARIQQLKNAKIVRKKGRYDLSAVKSTLYGKTVIESLGFKGRYMLKRDEYDQFKTKVNEMGFELPEEIEPTTAEMYFESM